MATAVDPSRSATAPVLLRPRNFQYYWNSTTDSSSIANEEQWQKYTDVENEIIEDAFNEKKDEVEIDGDYIINLQFMLQYNKLDNANAHPVKRVQLQTNRNISRTREERFPLSVAISSVFQTNTCSQNDLEQEQRDTNFSIFNYQITELAKKNRNITYVVEEAAQGIIRVGQAEGKIHQAMWLAQQLLDVKAVGDSVKVIEYEQVEIPSEIGEICVHLYTIESFWYSRFNKAMYDSTSNTREDVKTFGPFCSLLHNYLHQNKTYEIPIVFRGVNLTDEQRLKLQNDVQFPAFTSTSKSRAVAECRDANTLFIIDLNIKKREGVDVGRVGADISQSSAFPAEEEFIIWPQTSFHYLRHQYDKNKHIIYLKSYQSNC